MKFLLTILFCVYSTGLYAQLNISKLDQILKEDSSLSLFRVTHFIKGSFFKVEKDAMVYDLLGGHYTKQFLNDKGDKNVLVIFFDKNDNLLFNFQKQYSNFQLGNLKFADPTFNPIGEIVALTEVAGLAVRDTISGYTFFVSVSKDGVPFPVNITKSGSENPQPKLDIHSLLNNDIESIYLFDPEFSLTAILKFSGSSLEVISIKEQIKSFKMNCDLNCIKELDLNQVIEKAKTADKEGENVYNFRLEPGWLLDIED